MDFFRSVDIGSLIVAFVIVAGVIYYIAFKAILWFQTRRLASLLSKFGKCRAGGIATTGNIKVHRATDDLASGIEAMDFLEKEMRIHSDRASFKKIIFKIERYGNRVVMNGILHDGSLSNRPIGLELWVEPT